MHCLGFSSPGFRIVQRMVGFLMGLLTFINEAPSFTRERCLLDCPIPDPSGRVDVSAMPARSSGELAHETLPVSFAAP